MKTCLISTYFANKALQAHADGRFQAFARQLKKQGIPLTAALQLASTIKNPSRQTPPVKEVSASDLTTLQNLITRCEK